MGKFSIQQKSAIDLAERVLLFKRTIKQWIYYAGLKYMQKRKLSDSQESFLEDITDFLVEYIDDIENDKDFFKRTRLNSVDLSAR